jgi:hypothetical protein
MVIPNVFFVSLEAIVARCWMIAPRGINIMALGLVGFAVTDSASFKGS